MCEKTQSSWDTYVPRHEQHPRSSSKTYKYYCFVSLFNIRELSCPVVVPLGMARDS